MSQTLVIEVNEDATSIVGATLIADDGLSTIDLDRLPTLSHEGKTVVVLDGRSIAVHDVELPLVDDAKARKILPAVLDDRVASNDGLNHLALLSEQNSENGSRTVAVVARQIMENLLGLMHELGIKPDCATPDFMLLHTDDEVPVQLVHGGACLTRLPDGSGYALEKETAQMLDAQKSTILETDAWQTCLRNAASVTANLLQGAYAPRTSMRVSLLWWRRSAILGTLALLLTLTNIWFEARENFRRADIMYENAERLFRTALPEETRIVNMEVQLRRALASRRQQGGGEFFVLSNHVLRAVRAGDQALLETLRYSQDNGELVLDVSFASFAESTEFKRVLEEGGILVNEGSSRQEGSRVISEIRVRRP